MKIDIFTFCDSAKEYNGQLVIVGTFNVLRYKAFPASAIQFDMALRLTFEPEDKGNYHMTLTFTDKESTIQFIGPLETNIDITDAESEPKNLNVILTCKTLTFPHPGEYVVTVDINGEKFNSILYVKKVA